MPFANSTVTPFTGAKRGARATVLTVAGVVRAEFTRGAGDFVETHPTVVPGSAGAPAPPPIVTPTPVPSGTIRYHCGRLKSTPMRVTGGRVEYNLARTDFTAPRFTLMRRSPSPGFVFGRSITSRSGCSIIWACGAAGPEVSMRI